MMIPSTRPLQFIVYVALLAFLSCNSRNKNDNNELAESQNDQKLKNSDLEKDTDFTVAAADGGLLEVRLGELSQSHASSEKVKMFGQMMITDHSKANQELKVLAAEKNITMPASLSKKNQERYNELEKKTGKVFDKAYIKFMVKDHEEDIDDFQRESNKGGDEQLKSWASGKISVLKHHLEMAKQAEEAVKKLE